MKTDRDTLVKQLDILHERGRMVFEQRGNIKNWGVTVWVAVLAFVLSDKSNFQPAEAWLILIAPPIIFWIIEGFFAGTNLLTVQQTISLEKRLAEQNYTYTRYEEIYAVSGFSAFSAKDRFITMLQGIAIGTVSIHFALLTGASIFVAAIFVK